MVVAQPSACERANVLLLRHALLSAAPAQTFGIITLMFDNTVVSACLTYFVQWLVTKYRDSAGKVPTASCVHRGVCVYVCVGGGAHNSIPACLPCALSLHTNHSTTLQERRLWTRGLWFESVVSLATFNNQLQPANKHVKI